MTTFGMYQDTPRCTLCDMRRIALAPLGAFMFTVLAAGCGATATPASVASSSASARSSSSTAAMETSAAVESTPEPTPEPTFQARAADFKIAIKTLRKKCFGSAGCNVTYRIDPTYLGIDPIPESGTVEVTYVVKGFEDGDAVNTFTITGDTATYPSEEDGSIKSSKSKLSAVVTDVSYEP